MTKLVLNLLHVTKLFKVHYTLRKKVAYVTTFGVVKRRHKYTYPYGKKDDSIRRQKAGSQIWLLPKATWPPVSDAQIPR